MLSPSYMTLTHYSYVVNIGSSSPATYTVTYKPGEYGTGSQQTATKTKGTALTLKGAIFTRTGYTQTGWSTTDGGSKAYNLNGSYTTDAPITLYPYWAANGAPDLTFIQPSGWGDKLVISTTTGTSIDSTTFTTADKLYLDFSVKNIGNEYSSSVYVDVYVDGVKVDYWLYSAGLAANQSCTWEDKTIDALSVGTHTIKVQIRSDVNEMNTSNNTYSKAIAVTAATRPSNDDFANATLISGSSVTVSGSNLNATSENGEPLLSYKSSATTTVWWKWIAPENGSIQIDTVGSTFDTVLGVYKGSSVSSLVKAGENSEDDDSGGSGNTSKCTFDCTSGTTYHICVAGYNGKSGSITLHVAFERQVPEICTVTYNPGEGGIGEVIVDVVDSSSGARLRDASFTHENGYRQIAWCPRENYNPYKTGDGRTAPKIYELGEQIYLAGDLVLYPVWDVYVEVAYDPGAYGIGLRQTESGFVGVILKDAIFTRTGYVQTGWSMTDGGELAYGLGWYVAYAFDLSAPLYPYWMANTYAITYMLNGGTHGPTHPASATYDTGFQVSAPTRSGYRFAGWTVTSGLNTSTAKWGTTSSPFIAISDSSTKCGPGTVYFKNLTTVANATVTLYAQWEEIGGDGHDGDDPMPPTMDCGVVTPPKSLMVGAALTWKAKAQPGYVFAGWEWVNGTPTEAFLALSENERRNPTLKIKVANEMQSADLVATWARIDEDRIQSVELTSSGLAVACKSYVTASVSGLPSGLKFNKKTLAITGVAKKDEMKVVKVSVKNASGYTWKENWALTVIGGEMTRIEAVPGSHTTAGTPVEVWGDAQLGAVKGSKVYVVGKKASIKATPAKGCIFLGWYEDAGFTKPATWLPKGPRTASQSVVVTGELRLFARFVELKPWAVGTFNGGGDDGGLVTLTISKKGKVSGKFLTDGKTWKLSAATFADYDAETDAYEVPVTAKCGKETRALLLSVGADGIVCEDVFAAYRNGWKEYPLESVAKTLKGSAWTDEDADGLMKWKVGSSGAVKVTLTTIGLNGKSYSATCSTVLIPTQTEGEYLVHVYFPPKAGKFDGFSGSFIVRCDGGE